MPAARSRRPAHRRALAVVLLALALAAFPLGVLASHQFADVPNSNPFHNDIDAIADAGVTTGCGGGNYCPSQAVTREQMAAFMNRLGALGPGKVPVVNATKLDGLDSTAFLQSGDVVMNNVGTWIASSASVTVSAGASGAILLRSVAGTGYWILPLVGPLAIGMQRYGLAAVEVCHGILSTSDATILNTTAYDAEQAFVNVLINDPTDRFIEATGGCFTVTDATPQVAAGGVQLELQISFSAPGSASITSVRSTWTPV